MDMEIEKRECNNCRELMSDGYCCFQKVNIKKKDRTMCGCNRHVYDFDTVILRKSSFEQLQQENTQLKQELEEAIEIVKILRHRLYKKGEHKAVLGKAEKFLEGSN